MRCDLQQPVLSWQKLISSTLYAILYIEANVSQNLALLGKVFAIQVLSDSCMYLSKTYGMRCDLQLLVLSQQKLLVPRVLVGRTIISRTFPALFSVKYALPENDISEPCLYWVWCGEVFAKWHDWSAEWAISVKVMYWARHQVGDFRMWKVLSSPTTHKIHIFTPQVLTYVVSCEVSNSLAAAGSCYMVSAVGLPSSGQPLCSEHESLQ